MKTLYSTYIFRHISRNWNIKNPSILEKINFAFTCTDFLQLCEQKNWSSNLGHPVGTRYRVCYCVFISFINLSKWRKHHHRRVISCLGFAGTVTKFFRIQKLMSVKVGGFFDRYFANVFDHIVPKRYMYLSQIYLGIVVVTKSCMVILRVQNLIRIVV